MSARGGEFWNWSLDVYPRAKAALLSLQDRAGFNVNLMLWCVWRTRIGAPPDAAAIAGAMEAVAPWHDATTRPLRAMRRRLAAFGPAGEALKPRALAVEIEAERIEQEILGAQRPAGAPAPPQDVRAAAIAALESYAALAGSGRRAEYSADFAALADLLLS